MKYWPWRRKPSPTLEEKTKTPWFLPRNSHSLLIPTTMLSICPSPDCLEIHSRAPLSSGHTPIRALMSSDSPWNCPQGENHTQITKSIRLKTPGRSSSLTCNQTSPCHPDQSTELHWPFLKHLQGLHQHLPALSTIQPPFL